MDHSRALTFLLEVNSYRMWLKSLARENKLKTLMHSSFPFMSASCCMLHISLLLVYLFFRKNYNLSMSMRRLTSCRVPRVQDNPKTVSTDYKPEVDYVNFVMACVCLGI